MKSLPPTRSSPILLTVLAALVALVAAQTGSAYLDGQPDAGVYNGCGSTSLGEGCHSAAPSTDVQVVVTGFPTTYQPGKTYTLTVTKDGGPDSTSAIEGGFYFEVSAGRLAVPETMAGKVQVVGGTAATHTAVGARQGIWAIEWTAPGSGLVNAKAFVNAVNGDGTNSPDDQWARYEGTAFSAGGGDSAKTPGLSLVAVLGTALAIVATRRR